jgi:hypothetical protein
MLTHAPLGPTTETELRKRKIELMATLAELKARLAVLEWASRSGEPLLRPHEPANLRASLVPLAQGLAIINARLEGMQDACPH